MEVQQDFKELLALFNAHKVEYIIVGAYALAFHGAPRFTGDIDILVRPLQENAKKILSALEDFGFGSVNLTIDDFQKSDHVVQLGHPPVRVDIVTSITGVTWEEADQGKQTGLYGDVPVFFLGKEQYIANKRATGRLKDRADLETLGEK
ncbi:MAG TPA: hypothetical protein P5294_10945 [Smithellaceae bacterium]|mgnify:CR=1 FL=1|nr:hypothetical protein [Smithellaceae bacterium]HQI24675.1 hypothetical protein [Smithella sp.]HRS90318.1 hypothetical protein [Smithellaceae bacterium]HRV27045.1 hypothetical protein [Smithellaceae bacterium]